MPTLFASLWDFVSHLLFDRTIPYLLGKLQQVFDAILSGLDAWLFDGQTWVRFETERVFA